MNTVMREAARETAYFVPQERTYIDMSQNKFNMFDTLVETSA